MESEEAVNAPSAVLMDREVRRMEGAVDARAEIEQLREERATLLPALKAWDEATRRDFEAPDSAAAALRAIARRIGGAL